MRLQFGEERPQVPPQVWAVRSGLWCYDHVLVFLSRACRLGTAASTANLLDDVEGHSCGKKG